MNKIGSDAPSILFAIASIFAIGFMLFVFSHLFSEIYTDLRDTLNENPNIDATVANETLTDMLDYEAALMWDYIFLALVIGYIMVLVILAFITPADPVFYIIFIIISAVGLILSVGLSNAWETLAEDPTFSTTLTRFPITDTILNDYYPLFFTMLFVLVMILLFGKIFVGRGGGR